MAGQTFSEWLAERIAEGVSRRELARRLAEKHPEGATPTTVETQRKNLKRILGGSSPTQPTRDAIQDALGRSDAPSVDEESDSDLPTLSEAVAELREIRRRTFRLERTFARGV